jgi:uncharacterized membrane protein YraQ (UPF0718 family)
VIWPALVFGLLISAAVRAFIPVAALSRLFDGGSWRAQVIAGASGAPLMLCSCCVTPVFSSVYRRSSRLTIAVAASLAVPLALPTFFEIPLAVAILAAGAPAGAAAALLFAGPAVNLPSLLTVGQVAGWKAMVLIASMVWLVAVAGGIAIG